VPGRIVPGAAPPISLRPAPERARLRQRLERLYATFDATWLSTDPLEFVHRYSRPEDQEIAAFFAASFAFGNVRAIRASLDRLQTVLGPDPAERVDRFDRKDRATLEGLYHRWIGPREIAAALGALRAMRTHAGSIGGFFGACVDTADRDIGPALDRFGQRARSLAGREADAVRSFFPMPSHGSACKRLALLLRWMVRGGDGLDLGLWPGVPRRQLVLPLDTHLARLVRVLGLTERRTPGWATAVEATRSLAVFDPEDPVKYDFSLSRLGILDLCLHGRPAGECPGCPVPRVRALGRPAPARRAGAAA